MSLDVVPMSTWRYLPPQAQCKRCTRCLPIPQHAHDEYITAVEVALHRLSRVWEPALTAAKKLTKGDE